MPKEYLPLKIDPFRFADNATRLHGNLAIKEMHRLCTSLASDEGNVEVDINFGTDELGKRFLRGHLTTQLVLQCARCLESFDYAITSDFLLGMVQTDEEADKLPESYDPLVIKGIDLFIQDVIEDELIISLPIVPMHEVAHCKVVLPLATQTGAVPALEKENPFKVIETLREKRDKK